MAKAAKAINVVMTELHSGLLEALKAKLGTNGNEIVRRAIFEMAEKYGVTAGVTKKGGK